MAVTRLADAVEDERQTLGDRVYDHVRQLLISGRLAPGDRLSLRTLAEGLGVSMMPVREAVSRLVTDRALEVVPNRAIRVPVMSNTQFAQLARIRIEVEGFAAAEAARIRDAAGLERVRAAEDRFRRLAEAAVPDLPAIVEANQAIHFAIYEAAGLPDLVEIIGGLWLKIGPILNLDLRENPERLSTGHPVAIHAALRAAVEAGDPAAAKRALAEDVAGAAEFILSRRRLPD
jgi:DNA-binding GntR family transcriptional regulator